MEKRRSPLGGKKSWERAVVKHAGEVPFWRERHSGGEDRPERGPEEKKNVPARSSRNPQGKKKESLRDRRSLYLTREGKGVSKARGRPPGR